MTLALGVAPLAINRFLLNPALRSQALARAVLARSQNPDAFQFRSPWQIAPVAPLLAPPPQYQP
jgi:hypothetical protein